MTGVSGGFFDARDEGLADAEADYVIIGSGAGGSAAARALADRGSVIVLEEGPLVTADALTCIARHSMATLFRNQGKLTAFGRANTPILQGRCVGGGTFVNSAIVWRIPETVLADWQRRFGLDERWSTAALESAYRRIEDEMSARPVTAHETAGGQDLLMRDGATKANLAGRFLHRYERGCRGSGRCLHGCPHEAKQSGAVNYLRRAAASGATVHANARVDRIVTKRGRAVAVVGRVLTPLGNLASPAQGESRGRGPRARSFRVSARRAVIVCASAIQSPNLLRRSGVRLPTLGERFMSHPGTSVMGIYPHRVGAWSGASQGFEVPASRAEGADNARVKLESINVPPEVAAARFPGAGARFAAYVDRLDHIAVWAVAVRAEAEGRVRPSWLFGDHVRYDLGARDLDHLRRGMKQLARMHFLAGASEVMPGVYGMPEVLHHIDETTAFDNAPLDPRAYSLLATHLFGGCGAGKDPATSVVGPDLCVHGVEGLYVMDASVFPTNTGVNPQHGIMAIATAAAERLAG